MVKKSVVRFEPEATGLDAGPHLLSKATSASCPEGHSIMKGVASGRALDA